MYSFQLNWVCDSAWKSALGQSFFFIGSIFGMIFGLIADRFGRLPALILANLTAMLGNILTMFSRDVVFFSVSRFISGMATDSNFVMMYILVLEFIRPSARTLGLNLCIGIFYCVGTVVTPFIATAIGYWKTFLWITALPILIVPLFYFILPESVHWCILNGQQERALRILHRVAEFNGKRLDDNFDREYNRTFQLLQPNQAKNNKETLWGLFATPRLRRNTFILFFKS